MTGRAAVRTSGFETSAGTTFARGVSPAATLRYRRLRRDAEAMELVAAVARLRRVALRKLLARARGTAEVAAARQLAMYLVHVLLGRPQDVVGRLFGRDASTVSHACRVIEDLRDNPPLEAEISRVEAMVHGAATEERRHAG